MSASEQLLTLAEVSVALAGFAGIIATFQARGEAKRSRGDVLGLTTMVTMSLGIAAMSALPLAIRNFGFAEHVVWVASSAVLVFLYTAFLFYIRSRMINIEMRGVNRLIILFWWMFNFLMVFALMANLGWADTQRQYAVYFIALLNPLLFSGYMFIRLMLRPLWRDVRDQENQLMPASGNSRSADERE